MEVFTNGFWVEVDENGRFELPDRQFTAAELKKIARDVNRAIRKQNIQMDDYED